MKGTSNLLMSATALIAVLAISAMCWTRTAQTAYYGGSWHDGLSSSVTAARTGTHYVIAQTPEYTGTCSGVRIGQAVLASDPDITRGDRADCGGSAGYHPECCAHATWPAVTGTGYKSWAHQDASQPQGCGPVTATIADYDVQCNFDRP
jgi:hypothetical protein